MLSGTLDDEECDDGNAIFGDGCNNDCTICNDLDLDGYC
ncbi:MAG: hypothetical protein H6765_09835 [Candidatus Peribacteria bacterium]|nr:MAG: hypothetical protein H6765_09835 [Candidatus Peribacteria bacterium]